MKQFKDEMYTQVWTGTADAVRYTHYMRIWEPMAVQIRDTFIDLVNFQILNQIKSLNHE
jgi:hypothetical protein